MSTNKSESKQPIGQAEYPKAPLCFDCGRAVNPKYCTTDQDGYHCAACQPTVNDDPMAEYHAMVEEGKQILAAIDASWWRLGELADRVEKDYGEDSLAKYAKDIGLGSASVAERHRSVFRAWRGKEAPGAGIFPKSYAVARELQNLPDRFEIIKQQPNITKREAVALRQERAGKSSPEGKEQKPPADSFEESVQRISRVLFEVVNTIQKETNIADGVVDPDSALATALRKHMDPPWLDNVEAAFQRGLRFVKVLRKLHSEPEQEQEEPEQEEPEQEEPIEPEQEQEEPEQDRPQLATVH